MDRFDELATLLLTSARDTFRSNKNSADKAIVQLTDEQLQVSLSADTNSIAVVMAHVAGNLRSRWTDFLTTDGEKPWRQRDAEFIERQADRAVRLRDWEDGWRCVFDTLEHLTAADLLKQVTIRGESLSVPLALERSLTHCAYHVGQIIMQARILAGDAWHPITIPRGQSEQFNQAVWGGSRTETQQAKAQQAEHSEVLKPETQATDKDCAFSRAIESHNNITYQVESHLTAAEFVDLLKRSTLAARRPIAEPGTIEAMLRNADVIVTARQATTSSDSIASPESQPGTLLGVSRAITDFAYCTYLSDLAVDEACQRQGIGRKLIEFTHAVAGRGTTLVLLAAPAARDYYPHIGMQAHDSCWLTWRQPRS